VITTHALFARKVQRKLSNGVAALPPADHLLIERDHGQFVPSRRRRMMANVRVARLLQIPAEPSPELRIPALQLKRTQRSGGQKSGRCITLIPRRTVNARRPRRTSSRSWDAPSFGTRTRDPAQGSSDHVEPITVGLVPVIQVLDPVPPRLRSDRIYHSHGGAAGRAPVP
jgi:hypothetical protein